MEKIHRKGSEGGWDIKITKDEITLEGTLQAEDIVGKLKNTKSLWEGQIILAVLKGSCEHLYDERTAIIKLVWKQEKVLGQNLDKPNTGDRK